MCQNECLEVSTKVESQFNAALDQIALPVDQDKELDFKMQAIEEAAKKEFNKRCNLNEKREEYLDKLKARIEARKETKRQENKNIKAEIELKRMAESVEKQKNNIKGLQQENLEKNKELKAQTG